ncbi:MAG: ribonuclease, partial [Acidobacteria bacterium]|nr:ribonuclease [Acidobacteriota bacterium]
MSKELIVSSTAHETKVAIMEDDELAEIYFERESQHGLAGSIYKGRVTRVLPGMQSAFVNIGLERDAFLYVSDFFEDTEEYDRIVTTVEDKVVKMEEKAALEVQPEPAEPAEAEGAPAPAPAGVAPAADAPSPGPAAARFRPEEMGRDRRGRRGSRAARRRRMLAGRGFPESKYALPAGGGQAAAAPPAVAVESDFEVLPGESL